MIRVVTELYTLIKELTKKNLKLIIQGGIRLLKDINYTEITVFASMRR